MDTKGEGERRLLSIVDADQLRRILKLLLDESESLSAHDVRSPGGTTAHHTGLRCMARSVASTMSQVSPQRACSAGTPIGEARFGFR
jgi:hypothetical protein